MNNLPSVNKWSVRNILETIENNILNEAFPEMEQPDGFGKSYNFPSDVSNLNFLQLGSLQLKLRGWLSWGIKQQAKKETELNTAQTMYDIQLWSRVAEYQISAGGRKGLTKEMISAKIITEDEHLEKFTKTLAVMRGVVARLEAQNKIYSEQIQTLSREQSRREAEVRLI